MISRLTRRIILIACLTLALGCNGGHRVNREEPRSTEIDDLLRLGFQDLSISVDGGGLLFRPTSNIRLRLVVPSSIVQIVADRPLSFMLVDAQSHVVARRSCYVLSDAVQTGQVGDSSFFVFSDVFGNAGQHVAGTGQPIPDGDFMIYCTSQCGHRVIFARTGLIEVRRSGH